MREAGLEPAKALSHRILSPTHLTTLLPPHEKSKTNLAYKVFWKEKNETFIKCIFVCIHIR